MPRKVKTSPSPSEEEEQKMSATSTTRRDTTCTLTCTLSTNSPMETDHLFPGPSLQYGLSGFELPFYSFSLPEVAGGDMGDVVVDNRASFQPDHPGRAASLSDRHDDIEMLSSYHLGVSDLPTAGVPAAASLPSGHLDGASNPHTSYCASEICRPHLAFPEAPHGPTEHERALNTSHSFGTPADFIPEMAGCNSYAGSPESPFAYRSPNQTFAETMDQKPPAQELESQQGSSQETHGSQPPIASPIQASEDCTPWRRSKRKSMARTAVHTSLGRDPTANVPQKYAPNLSLGVWVNKQRMEYKAYIDGKHNSMTARKMYNLQIGGFNWAKRKGQAAWDEKLQELHVYKAMHGSCDVPTKFRQNRALGRWVSSQRSMCKAFRAGNKWYNIETSEIRRRLQLLENLGFSWNMMPSSSDSSE